MPHIHPLTRIFMHGYHVYKTANSLLLKVSSTYGGGEFRPENNISLGREMAIPLYYTRPIKLGK